MQEGFIKYIENQGIADAELLTEFLVNFLEDPGVYFDLTPGERQVLERQLDSALALFRD